MQNPLLGEEGSRGGRKISCTEACKFIDLFFFPPCLYLLCCLYFLLPKLRVKILFLFVLGQQFHAHLLHKASRNCVIFFGCLLNCILNKTRVTCSHAWIWPDKWGELWKHISPVLHYISLLNLTLNLSSLQATALLGSNVRLNLKFPFLFLHLWWTLPLKEVQNADLALMIKYQINLFCFKAVKARCNFLSCLVFFHHPSTPMKWMIKALSLARGSVCIKNAECLGRLRGKKKKDTYSPGCL